MNGARPGYEPDPRRLSPDDRVLVLETQLGLLRDAIDRINALADVVIKTSAYAGECSARSARVMEYLDRLERRATESEKKISNAGTRVSLLEKVAYTAAGFSATAFSGVAVYLIGG